MNYNFKNPWILVSESMHSKIFKKRLNYNDFIGISYIYSDQSYRIYFEELAYNSKVITNLFKNHNPDYKGFQTRFQFNNIENAQKYVDNFLNRVEKLIAFK